MKYIYRALKPGGEEINGDIEAPDEQTAKKEIRNFGLFPIKISPYKEGPPQDNIKKEREPKKSSIGLSNILKLILGIVLLVWVAQTCNQCNRETKQPAKEYGHMKPQTATRIQKPKHEIMKTRSTDIRVSATKLLEAYEANEVAADSKYRGKILEVTGTIDSIAKGILNSIYVVLRSKTDEYSITGVQCFFSKKYEYKISLLKKDQTITIKGRCDGKMMNVSLTDCALIRK